MACKQKKNNSIILAALSAVVFVSGCATELSNIDGVSIRNASRKWSGRGSTPLGGFGYWNCNIQDILQNRKRTLRLVSSVDLSGDYDFVFSAERHDEIISFELRTLEQTFGISIKQETREIPASILSCIRYSPLKLIPSQPQKEPDVKTSPTHTCWHFYHIGDLLTIFRPYEPTTHTFQNYTISDLAYWLEKYQKVIIVDETNIKGAYNFSIVEDPKKGVTLIDSLRQLGLELKECQRPITAIYVDKLTSVQPSVHLKKLGRSYQVYPAWEKP